jgi:hypothetical protein
MLRLLAATALLAAAALTTPHIAAAKRRPKPQPCAPGTFALDDVARAKLAALLDTDAADLAVGADGTVQLGTCTATAHVRAKRRRCGAASRTVGRPLPPQSDLALNFLAVLVPARYVAPQHPPALLRSCTRTGIVSGKLGTGTFRPAAVTWSLALPAAPALSTTYFTPSAAPALSV